MTTKEEKLRMTAFKVDSGYKSVTEGILLYNHTFEVDMEGQPVRVPDMRFSIIRIFTSRKRNVIIMLPMYDQVSDVQHDQKQ